MELRQASLQKCKNICGCLTRITNITSVYPAKGRPESRTTKLDSGAQKRSIRSPIEGYGPRTQASARLARAEVGP